MREILFRGQSIDRHKWYEGDLYQTRLKSVFYINYYTEYGDRMAVEVDTETVGQYTGLSDKNGRKIFEGDIVKYTHFGKFSDNDELEEAEEKDECIDVIRFVNGKFIPFPKRYDCDDYWYSYADDNFEVIGNIHDNPELIKGGAE